MKMVLGLPGAASQKKQSCLFPNHSYLFPPLFLVPPQRFVQQGSEPKQTKGIKLVLEENKAWISWGRNKHLALRRVADTASASSVCGSLAERSPRLGVLLWSYQVCLGSWEFVWLA